MDKLKPCPFCGSNPIAKSRSLDERYGFAMKHMIFCTKCGASKGAQGDTSKGVYADNNGVEQAAIAAWNKRAESPELTAANARIAELEKALEPFAREEIGTMYKDPWHLQFSDPDGFVDFTDFTIGDLRRAAALLNKEATND